MKRALCALAAAMLLVASVGCHWTHLNSTYNGCAGGGCGHGGPHGSDPVSGFMSRLHGRGGGGGYVEGPPTAAYSYPYYTTRGPRDFFLDNPPSIGN
jgi:hypothetical protein